MTYYVPPETREAVRRYKRAWREAGRAYRVAWLRRVALVVACLIVAGLIGHTI